jgi:hypothetical protein
LKKTEKETHITGEQYTERLQEHFNNNTPDIYSWAKKPTSTSNVVKEEEEDPIA